MGAEVSDTAAYLTEHRNEDRTMSNPLEGFDASSVTPGELASVRELLQRDLAQVEAARSDAFKAINAGDYGRLGDFNKFDAVYKRMADQLQQVDALTSRVQMARAAGMSLQAYLEATRNE